VSYFFVGGCARSGTTLLQALLCRAAGAHPMIRESRYLRVLLQAYGVAMARFDAETEDYFRDRAALRAYHAKLIDDFLSHTRAHLGGAEHLVLKEPNQTRLFPEILSLVPAARCLCLVRDPRDTIASLVRVGQRYGDHPADRGNPDVARLRRRNMRALCAHYLSFYKPVLALAEGRGRERLMLIRYEDLVRSPAAELARVAAFTGLALDGVDPHASVDLGSYPQQFEDRFSRPWTSDLYGKPLTAERIGGYGSVLAAAEIAAIERWCGPFMARFRYR